MAPPFLSLLGSSSVISLSLGLSSYWCACALSLHSFHRLLEVLSSTCVAFDVHSVITRALSFSLSCFFLFSVFPLFYSCFLFLRHRRRSSVRVRPCIPVSCLARPSRVMTYFAGRAPPSPAGSSLHRVSLSLACAALCCSLSWSIMQGERMRDQTKEGGDAGRQAWRE